MDSPPRPDLLLVPDFVPDPSALFDRMVAGVDWDRRMKARLTASWGRPYDYAGIDYAARPMPAWLLDLCARIERGVGFLPDNCLANYYPDGNSKMGFHADSIAELAEGCGVAIVSLGAERPLRFRRMDDVNVRHSITQPAGSLLYMPQDVNREWVHAIPRQRVAGPRISLTFRKLAQAGGGTAQQSDLSGPSTPFEGAAARQAAERPGRT